MIITQEFNNFHADRICISQFLKRFNLLQIADIFNRSSAASRKQSEGRAALFDVLEHVIDVVLSINKDRQAKKIISICFLPYQKEVYAVLQVQ
jgi:hypothetical protein